MPAPYRKACVHCVKSKRRCDQATPCYRCKVRSLECHYQNAPLSSQSKQRTDLMSEDLQGYTPVTVDVNELFADSSNLDQMMNDVNTSLDNPQVELSLPPFPDPDLDWSDVMGHLESFSVPDHITINDSPTRSVLAGEIYQERIVFSIKRMKSYPGLFVRQCQTPFINKRLYTENLPDAIQDVLGICSLYNQKNESNQNLIFRTISYKVKNLIDNYTPVGMSAIQHLASIQALILYQIIRLFDGDIRQRADAERDDLTLRDWTKQLKHRTQRIDTVSRYIVSSTVAVTVDSWETWIFAESLRRTVICSYALQGLYCFLKNGWDDSHHEFQDLSFYAQKALWEAPSMYYWKSALEEKSPLPVHFCNWDSDITDAKPSDIEDLGMMMMVLMKGVDHCSEWAGSQNLEKFGLAST
ncbi:hypothetical protein BGW36DRAFT_376733 [Talaromyces proteolyticus]|uniref:Zn(2)-C6 fungal-type domain-containing protein n=1 Tax=Talaromyces proteolyticus TaxID=1131652 RepID=A0AAD4PX05_9EURO|nr:uncharacterized protein BGW36DRAFT_376733 [Talaromyces proteolyticus]KAH8698787.1 hypothetical protein BGW36DRAFT_376733 [Talaromyces proteolyticus]